MLRLHTFAKRIIGGLLTISMAGLVVMMMTIVCDVFMRFIFNAPITGAYDVVEICLVIAVLYSLGTVILGADEILIDIIDQIAPPGIINLLRRIAALLSAGVLIFIFVSMVTPAIQSHQYGEMRLELNLPVWIFWAIALVGMAGGVLASLLCLFAKHDDENGTATVEDAS